MKCKRLFICNPDGKNTNVCKLYVADNFALRSRGLLLRKKITSEEAMLLTDCNNIHTFGMTYPIDIVFLNDKKQVIDIRENIKPYRLAFNRQAKDVIEFAGYVSKSAGIQVGMSFAWE